MSLEVLVVGAGLSGLATAISCALAGHAVTVFESAKELLEVFQLFVFVFESTLANPSRSVLDCK